MRSVVCVEGGWSAGGLSGQSSSTVSSPVVQL